MQAYRGMNREEFEKGVTLLWAIWNNRNNEVKEGRRNTVQGTLEFALTYWEEYKRNQVQNVYRGERTDQKWEQPPLVTVKLNFDGAWQASTLTGGIGVVARDKDGEVL
ncbi:hypothetical protein DITRI_Ditri10aG0045800 [Diplodiscus trichospermus]